MFTTTIVDPTGVLPKIDNIIPTKADITDINPEAIMTNLKFLNKAMADIAGNITRADINREPTKFIAKTIVAAVIIAKIKLYIFTLVPIT